MGFDQESCLEDVIMEDPLQDVDGQFSFEEDVIINTLKEESKNLYFAIKLD